MMPETRFTEFPALSVDSRVGISQSAAVLSSDKEILTRGFSEFPASSVDWRVRISQSASVLSSASDADKEIPTRGKCMVLETRFS